MGKPRIIQTSVETVVIPTASKEHFLTQPSKNIHCMDDHKILLAGISHLTPGYRVERAPSYFNLILYCHRGTAVVKSANRTLELRPGEVMLIPTGSNYAYQPSSRHWDVSWAHLIDSPEWNMLFGPSLLIHKAQWGRHAMKTMESYIEEANTRYPDSRHALQLCIELLVFYIKRELGIADPDLIEAREKLQLLWRNVRENLHHKWTAEEMAASIGLCKTRFYHLCKKVHKTTPMDMVATMRMERAAELLFFTTDTLSMVADAVGYETAFSFSAAFKRHTGTSPKEYRGNQDCLRKKIGD